MNQTTTQINFDDATRNDAKRLIDCALVEDTEGKMDCTTMALIPVNVIGSAKFVARDKGVISGLAVAKLVIEQVSSKLNLELLVSDGDFVEPLTTLARITGPARQILTAERTCLNFLGRLSGVATLTRRFVSECQNTNAQVLDTRKTTPGWRRLEKYAVRCGGGQNHRMGLYDAVLIKDNHLAMCGNLPPEKCMSIPDAIESARKWITENHYVLPRGEDTLIQIEVDSLEQLRQALPCVPDMVLLDNMTVDQLAEAVEIRNTMNESVLLEASGGVNLETVSKIAKTGVDRISVGALTHSATNFDIGLDWAS